MEAVVVACGIFVPFEVVEAVAFNDQSSVTPL
jgi:hypothetical protein